MQERKQETSRVGTVDNKRTPRLAGETIQARNMRMKMKNRMML